MNFLAHTMFAQHDPEVIVGQFLGDFIRGQSPEDYAEKIQQGITLHRRIDSYTDQHPVNLEARSCFTKPYRRFAGILTDVVYDHYLARTWATYSDITLEGHIKVVHEALEDQFETLPLDLQRFARFIIDRQVLASYRHFDAVDKALDRLARRSPRFFILAEAGQTIRDHDDQLSDCFARFYPDLIQHMANS